MQMIQYEVKTLAEFVLYKIHDVGAKNSELSVITVDLLREIGRYFHY